MIYSQAPSRHRRRPDIMSQPDKAALVPVDSRRCEHPTSKSNASSWRWKQKKNVLVTAIEGARSAAIENGELYVEFAPEARHLRDSLAKSDSVKILREICQEITGQELGVRIMIKDQAVAVDDAPLSREDEERREQNRLREDAEKHPLVQQMLRTFRGELVDVRRVDKSHS